MVYSELTMLNYEIIFRLVVCSNIYNSPYFCHEFVNGVLGTVYREIGEPGKEYPTRAELAKKREEESVSAEAPTNKGAKKKEENK